jgi:endonuclease/exonuclease/phosphatase family metal-dependent hydrolase
MRRYFSTLCSTILLGSIILFTGCDDNSNPVDPDPEPKPSPIKITTHDEVPADNQLETVTWNLEWFGSYSQGPSDPRLQLKNVLTVMDTLEADLYGLEEFANTDLIDSLEHYMPGYSAMYSDHISQTQKLAFLYNTNTIKNVAFTYISSADGLDSNDFAGRLPFVMNFDYQYEGGQQSFMAIVIHAKCCTGESEYNRRKRAADSLYQYLQEQHPDDNIILMGDYNDDIDESIYQTDSGYKETPYISFKQNDQAFTIVTGELGLDGTSSTVRYDDVIDHITYSNEVMPFYLDGSAKVMKEVAGYVEGSYGSTTTDHYPVRAIITFE